MIKHSKRIKSINTKINKRKHYNPIQAFDLLKKCSKVKFKESIEVAINLNINAKNLNQVIRGISILPNGTGKVYNIAVFTQGENVNKAKNAGAKFVGLEDLSRQFKEKKVNADIVFATPDVMQVVSQLGKVLGPKGLMPNPKLGTITTDVVHSVENAQSKQIQYRIDKSGIIHTILGNIEFSSINLEDNLKTLLFDLKKNKPQNAKKNYFKKITVSSTMGPGLMLDITNLKM